MGFELVRFVDHIQNEYLCSVCALVVENPLESINCGHIYCAVCINGWMQLEQSCPEDRTALKPEHLKKAGRLILSLVNKLRIKCDYYSDGCQAIVSLKDLEGHLNICSFASSSNYEEEDTMSLIEEVIQEQMEEMELETLHASPWQVCHNVKTSTDDQTTTLEFDVKSPSGFIQASTPLNTTNSFFRIEIANLDSLKYLAIGLTAKGHPVDTIPGLHKGSVGCDSIGDFVIQNKSKNVGLRWKVGDVIECGIKFCSDLANGAVVYFKRNQIVIAENPIEIPNDGCFPTIYLYEGVVGCMWAPTNAWSSNTRIKVNYFRN